MKIAIIGDFADPHSTNHHMAAGFESDERIERIDRIPYRDANGTPLQSLQGKEQIADGAVVIVCKGYGMPFKDLHALHENHFVVYYFMDPLSTAKFGKAHDYAALSQFAVCTSRSVANWLGQIVDAIHLSEGFAGSIYKPVEREKMQDVLFIGNATPERVAYLKQLKEYFRAQIAIYGSGYKEDWATGPGQYSHAEATLYHYAKIGLNLCRDSGFSDRVLKMMACGLPVVSTVTPGLIQDFVPGKHFYPVSEPREAINAICALLDDDTKRNQIAQDAQRFVQKYTWTNIAKEIIDEIEERQR
jgi:spore maturation protein CgeB